MNDLKKKLIIFKKKVRDSVYGLAQISFFSYVLKKRKQIDTKKSFK